MKLMNQQLNNAVKNLAKDKNTPITTELMEKAEALKAKIGSIEFFKDKFCPAMMVDVARDPGRAYKGIAPTLEVVRLAYGGDADVAWLNTFLDDFNEYYGKGKMTIKQITGVAQRMSAKSHLRVTEFMLFFWRLGNAEYGKIYGVVDPLYIMDSFNKFLKQREIELGDYSVTTTDDVDSSNKLPAMHPRVLWLKARNGELAPEVAEIVLQELGPYDC